MRGDISSTVSITSYDADIKFYDDGFIGFNYSRLYEIDFASIQNSKIIFQLSKNCRYRRAVKHSDNYFSFVPMKLMFS